MEYFTLLNGIKIPMLGLGTWGLKGNQCIRVVCEAIDLGYTLIDTARMYKNEEAIGKSIKKSGIKREELFLTSKVCSPWDSYKGTKKAVEDSLRLLGTDYIDLFLIHEPYKNDHEMFEALCELYRAGKIRAVGVSNFLPNYFADFIRYCTEMPMVNQMESHVYFPRLDYAALLKRSKVLMQAWAPFTEGRRDIFSEPILMRIGEKYQKTAAQVALKYLLQNGIAVIPKTSKSVRLKENIDIFDFLLTEEDMQQINTIDSGRSLFGWY